MSLNSSLSIASSGLAALQSEMAVASQNVANANTAGYVVETSSVSSRTAGGQAGGVLLDLTTRSVNAALESSLYTQNAAVSALTTTSDALAPISALQGSTSADSGSSDTLSDDVGNLQSSLITVEADPSNVAGQQAVLSAAGALASNIRDTSAAYQTQRQAAQESIVTDVTTANTNLNLIGTLSREIAGERINGISTADLENQRASAMTALSNVLSVKFSETASGDMLVSTSNGLQLPTHSTSGPLSTSDATVTASSAYLAASPNDLPGITLAGRDITSSLTGGTLGANLALRDQVLPTMQAELDSYSQALATRFDAQGLTLFTDGTLPATTTAVAVTASLPGSTAITDGTDSSTSLSQTSDVYDSTGTRHADALGLTWSQVSGSADTWTVTASVNGTTSAAAEVVFNTDGTLASIAQQTNVGSTPATYGTAVDTSGAAAAFSVPASFSNGTSQSISVSLGEIDSTSGTTMATSADGAGSAATISSNSVTSTAGLAAAGQAGFAGVIQVNPVVTADPSLVRDGTHDVTGSSSGASAFTVNSSRGVDDATLIDRLINYSLGADAQTGVVQTAAASTGLGVNGSISTPYGGTSDLVSLATSVTSSQASTIDQASSDLTNETAIQTSVAAKIASVSGVSVDDEMSSIVALQNAYAANAKVVTTVQTMFTALLSAIN